MIELLHLFGVKTVTTVLNLLQESPKLQEFRAFPSLIDENTYGWWRITPFGAVLPTSIHVWTGGVLTKLVFKDGVLSNIVAQHSGAVTF